MLQWFLTINMRRKSSLKRKKQWGEKETCIDVFENENMFLRRENGEQY